MTLDPQLEIAGCHDAEVEHLYHARDSSAMYDSGKIRSGVNCVVCIEILFHAPSFSK